MVKRQTRHMEEEDMERVVLTDKRGKVAVKKAEVVLNNKNEVLI